jgi:hypothetical protein
MILPQIPRAFQPRMVSPFAGHQPAMSIRRVGSAVLGGSQTTPSEAAPEYSHGRAQEAPAYAASGGR